MCVCVRAWVFHICKSKSKSVGLIRVNARARARICASQRKKNTQSGTEFARTKEAQAAIMREKQNASAAKRDDPGTATGSKK